MFPNHNLESNDIYKSKYYKYKKKYLDLKKGGALRSSTSLNNGEHKDPTTRQVFTNELINQAIKQEKNY
jgi:hypothetical protein